MGVSYKTMDEKKLIDDFIATFDLSNEHERRMGKKVIDYIIRQLNDESLKGYLYFSDYQTIIIAGVDGLFKEIYINEADFGDKTKRNMRLMRYDVIFASAYNLFLMLMTRVNLGRDRELIIKDLESKKNILLTK